MAKESALVQDLKRVLVRLARLEGRPLACAEGLWLFAPKRVKDPRPLLAALDAGPPPAVAVAASLELTSPPFPLTAGLLGAATRDLRVLQEPHARAALREAHRVFRRHGALDEAWHARWRARLADLGDRLHAVGAPASWTARALDAIALAHGDEARDVVAEALGHLRGRARAREQAARFLLVHALAFDPRPRRGGALDLASLDLERGPDALDAHLDRFRGVDLRLDEVLGLAPLKLENASAAAARLVARGLPVGKVQRLAELGHAKDLVQIEEDPAAAEAYADWAAALVPHYKALGLDVPLTPAVFEHVRRGTRREDLAVLAVCLMKHHTRASADSAGEALARLDATLGLFQRRPAEAASILAELSGTSPGAGREALPELAAWLGDDALLDRYVHLCRLAGAPVPLSRTLRADFDRAARLEGERAHLAALLAPMPAQAERLRRLEHGEVAPPDPARTRRRLADRLDDLTARAYERRLDAVFRGILKQVFRISLPRLTPAWRDALRFYLAAQKNRDLTGTVLRAAAAGADLARSLPRNRAWIDEVSGRMDVGAWLAPRSREVVLGGKVHRLAVERDPIEVLRMGIPFDTCLSLESGMNAASTVINAADANKLVLYLRDPEGAIVARKLVAVSEAGALVGYNLYVAARQHAAAIGEAFQGFCADLAAAARLPLSADGTPRQIHAGFWYDDGSVPFTETVEAAPVKAYCRSIGLAPAPPDETLTRRARLFDALARRDTAGVAVLLRDFGSGVGIEGRAAAFLLGRLDGRQLVAEARRSDALAVAAVAQAAGEGPIPMLEMAARIADRASAGEAADRLLRFPRTLALGVALVTAATRTLPFAAENDGWGLDHRAALLLPRFAGALPVAEALALCDRAEPLLRAMTRGPCADCAATCQHGVLHAIEIAYASARDPEAVIHTLGSARAGRLATRAALRVASRYALSGDAHPSLPPPALQPLHPSPAALRALTRLRARVPDLDADPEMLAALIRQAGGLPRDLSLPTPGEAPFEALGDLLAQIDLAPVVAPFSVDGPLPAWKPGPWELYHHRRHRTPRRAALVTQVRQSPPPPAACDWLARLGDVGALHAAYRVLPARSRDGVGSRLALAGYVESQVEACRAGAPLSAILADPSSMPSEAIDRGLVLASFAHVEERAGGSAGADRLAQAILQAGGVPDAALLAVAARLAAGGPPAAPEHAFVAQVLRQQTAGLGPESAPDIVAAFGAVPALSDDLGYVLSHLDDFPAVFPAVEAALIRAGHEEAVDPLLAATVSWMIADDHEHHLAGVVDEALYRRAVRAALETRGAGGALAVYRRVWVPEHMAMVLDELAQSGLARGPEWEATLQAHEGWLRDADNAAQAAWLRARLP